MTSYLFLIAALIAAIAGIRRLFQDAEANVRPEIKESAANWLKNFKPEKIFAKWPEQFAALFDHVFGKRHFSFKCFYRSCIASTISVVTMTLIWAAIREDEFFYFINDDEVVIHIILACGAFFFVNLFSDYLSLLETRYMINYIKKDFSTLNLIVVLTFDIVATYAIIVSVGAVFLEYIYLDRITPNLKPEDKGIIEWFFSSENLKKTILLTAHQKGWYPVGIYFYSTFFASVWLWLYALSGFTVKIAISIGLGIDKFRDVFDVEETPISAIGFVASIFLIIVAFLCFLIKIVF